MEASIKTIEDYFNESSIKLSAQTYLKKFYTNLGFASVGEEYFEDGISHVIMIKN
jgi:ElaA protein